MYVPEETLDVIDPRSLIGKKVVVVVGPTDVGKSTFIKRVYNELCRKLRVFVLDSDVGQSDVGPPCTITLGTGDRPVESLGELSVVGVHFFGATSPSHDTGDFLWGVGRMLAKVRSCRPDMVIVNTTGWVDSYQAFSLKMAKISVLSPDLVVLVGVEMGEYFRFLSSSKFTTVWVRPSVFSTKRDQDERRKRRIKSVMDFFEGKREMSVNLRDIVIFGDVKDLSPRKDTGEDVSEGILRDLEWRMVGFLGPDLRSVGIGWIQRVDLEKGRLIAKSFFPDRESFRYVKFGYKFVPF